MSAHSIPRSTIECFGSDSSRCGYCQQTNTSHSYGVFAHRLDVRDYQNMLDAGWRRSGHYLYRPDLTTTCCPTYVVRLDTSQFIPSSTHKRVLKRLRRFSTSSPSSSISMRVHTDEDDGEKSRERDRLLDSIRNVMIDCGKRFQLSPDVGMEQIEHVAHNQIKVFPSRRQTTTWCSNAAMALAAIERANSNGDSVVENDRLTTGNKRERRKRNNNNDNVKRQMSIACTIVNQLQQPAIGLIDQFSISVTSPGFINFCPVHNDTEDDVASTQTGMDVDTSNKMDIPERSNYVKHTNNFRIRQQQHGQSKSSIDESMNEKVSIIFGDIDDDDDISSTTTSTSTATIANTSTNNTTNTGTNTPSLSPSPSSPTEKRIEYFEEINARTRDGQFSMEVVTCEFRNDAYEIFKRYQMTIHKESIHECGKEAYCRFLVDSPLKNEKIISDTYYGSFHVLYKLQGKLFAVGVIDILPKCLSSVYLFYDPEYSKLSPGTLSALKEIQWIQSNNIPEIKYYYMGFYIHSCDKMKYKINFVPSQLLCDVTKQWISTNIALNSLNNHQDKKNKNIIRLAPVDVLPALQADDFNMDHDEVALLANESTMKVGNSADGSGRERRLLSYRTLAKSVRAQYPERVEIIGQRLRRFVQLVGRSSVKYFMHIS